MGGGSTARGDGGRRLLEMISDIVQLSRDGDCVQWLGVGAKGGRCGLEVRGD